MTTNVCLACVLCNIYAVAFAVVIIVVVMVMFVQLKLVVVWRMLLLSVPTATTIAAIDKVVFLWFISQKLSSIILYLRCFTATANNIGEFVDIFKH